MCPTAPGADGATSYAIGDEVSGIVDWSETSHGDPLFDLATVMPADEEHLMTSSWATAPTSTAT